MSQALPVGDVKALLQQRIEGLCLELCPDGFRSGAYWIARNPSREDRRPGSFFVWLKGAGTGAWKDESTGQKGDVIDLIVMCRRLGADRDANARGAAIRWARDWLGVAPLTAEQIAEARTAAAARRTRSRESEAAELVEKQRRAFGWWLQAEPEIRGTPVEAYLAGRGIDLSRLPRLPRALRYDARLHHRPSGTVWPGMMAAMTNDKGRVVAVHRTFLAADGSGKAPVDPARMIWPSFAGAAIRIWRGESGLSPEEAGRLGVLDTLAVTEGIEDALTVALARPEWRVWAAGSLGNLATIAVPACSDRVVVCADNDWGKPQAERLLTKALQALAAQGAAVSVARSSLGKDMNDQLRGQAA